MVRALLSPRWLVLHAAVAAIVAAFGVLGWWQFESYRAGDQTPGAANRSAVPAPLGRVLSPGQPLPAEAVERRVFAKGKYDADGQLLVPGRELRGKRGYLVVTPLRTAAGVLPVHRGWVRSRTARAAAVPAGTVTVAGPLMPSETEGNSRVDPTLFVEGELPFIATPELMARLTSYPPAEIYEGYLLLEAQRPRPAAAPEYVAAEPPASSMSPLRNLSYAAQWWVFALAAVWFWLALVRRAAAERAAPVALPHQSRPALDDVPAP